METSKLGLQSSKLEREVNSTGKTKFKAVIVSEGAKLNRVCAKLPISAAFCWLL